MKRDYLKHKMSKVHQTVDVGLKTFAPIKSSREPWFRSPSPGQAPVLCWTWPAHRPFRRPRWASDFCCRLEPRPRGPCWSDTVGDPTRCRQGGGPIARSWSGVRLYPRCALLRISMLLCISMLQSIIFYAWLPLLACFYWSNWSPENLLLLILISN